MTRIRSRLKELGVEPIGAESTSESEKGDDTVREHVVRRAEELRRKWAEDDSRESEQEDAPAEVQPVVTLPVASQTVDTASVLDGDGEVQAVYAAIREARVPIGRAEIIERSGIDPGSWLNVIRSLTRNGMVVMQGSKRGARYTLPAPAASNADLFAEMKA